MGGRGDPQVFQSRRQSNELGFQLLARAWVLESQSQLIRLRLIAGEAQGRRESFELQCVGRVGNEPDNPILMAAKDDGEEPHDRRIRLPVPSYRQLAEFVEVAEQPFRARVLVEKGNRPFAAAWPVVG